ncbi:NAD(P)-dependent oxidoreductase [Croceicoccus sp. BE223]|uniref:NAD-dependent epimerase/dehydratase family protein n=1 Tax=Croceicoccus sp. BE223 TaxID=2817716 RepID=UPI002865DF9F|nr:NAD(P)-dependent oxidoreductase [Croceicoccus sp. BE223]MDR7103661.1 nucleoside-diphosphate-sugar epimerase [Croceicoccus sp. BE223]
MTGVTGKAVLPVAAALAQDNEVFGQARFSDDLSRERVAALGIVPCRADLAEGGFSELPDQIDHLLHFAWTRLPADRLEEAMRVNVEGAGLLLHRYRRARSALVVSSSAVYRGHPDPLHRYREGDPVGAGPSVAAETSAVCKIALEGVARLAARTSGLPITIARLNTVMGPHRAYYGKQVEAILAGREIVLPAHDNAHNPVHVEDMAWQVEPLLEAASAAALTVNWSGDETAISRDVIARIARRTGQEANVIVRTVPGLAAGTVTDTAKRMAITGPCRSSFDEALDRMLDEMLDAKPSTIAQRDWDYANPWQDRIFRGEGEA